jgi:hypothetical protein
MKLASNGSATVQRDEQGRIQPEPAWTPTSPIDSRLVESRVRPFSLGKMSDQNCDEEVQARASWEMLSLTL